MPVGQAATTVSGSTQGLWSTQGSPYLVIADLTIPKGQSLTVEPGVEVVVAPDVTITVLGQLLAEGQHELPITWQGASPDRPWNHLRIHYSGALSRLQYCHFTDASNGVYLTIIDVNAVMVTEILNCTFKNIVETCIYGRAEGGVHGSMSGWGARQPSLNPIIRNCQFQDSGAGCRFHISGRDSSTGGCCPPGHIYGRGFAHPLLANNIFKNLAGPAWEGLTARNAGASFPTFINNTIDNCALGVAALPPFDVGITNNIFSRCQLGVMRTGDLTLNVLHNAFHANTTNFIGYPETFGDPLIENVNGDPTDLAFNLILDPQFANLESLVLAADSPCIDAGFPGLEDTCFPPSLGTAVSDMGAYGGMFACDWPPLECTEPRVIRQPRNLTTCVGQSATLTAEVSGTKTLAFQWYDKNGFPVPGATNASLIFDSIRLEDAGSYYVEAVNGCGSVTTQTASIHVTEICLSLDIYPGLTMGNLTPGTDYLIQATLDVGDTNSWETVHELEATSPDMFWMDPQSTRLGKRFYRVREQ